MKKNNHGEHRGHGEKQDRVDKITYKMDRIVLVNLVANLVNPV
jgi:hypothetical protein